MMFANRISSSTSCSIWLPETSPPSSARAVLRHRFQSCNTSVYSSCHCGHSHLGCLFLSCEAILAHPPSIEPNGAAGLADAHHLFLRGPKEREIDTFGKHSG